MHVLFSKDDAGKDGTSQARWQQEPPKQEKKREERVVREAEQEKLAAKDCEKRARPVHVVRLRACDAGLVGGNAG